MKTLRRRAFVTGVAAFLTAGAAEAKTVLWYRLDLLATGVTSTPTTVINNIANPGTYQMYCHSLVGADRGTDPNYMPYGTQGLPSGIWVYDPVTREGAERLNAMHFGLTEIPPGTSSASGAMLRTDAPYPSAPGLTNVTVEAIFRASAGDLASWSMAPLVYQQGNNGYDESYALEIGWRGRLACRFNAGGTSRVVGGSGSSTLVTPDVWHHAAFTLDAGSTAKLYLDYQLVGTLTGCGTLTQYSGKALMIGANTHVANRTFPGDIMEVRISDKALASDALLQVRVRPRVTPDDTAYFCPDIFGINYRFRSVVNVNAATGSLARTANPMSETNSPAAALAAPCAPYTVQDCKGYNSWPMMQAVGRRLVCTYSRGTGHNISEGVRGVFARTSDDCGRTWAREVCVADEPNYGEVTIGKGLDEDGDMLLWVRCLGGPSNHHDLYRTADGVKFEKIATPTLSPLPMQITDIFHVPGRGMMSLWFAGDYNSDAGHSWGTLVSADNGRTWTQTTIEKDLSKADWPTEQAAAYVGDGKILAIARTEFPGSAGGVQFQLTSTDRGETWKRERTNISDIMCSTPTLVYDEQSGLVSNYYFERGKGLVKRRVNAVAEVWSAPTRWAEPEIVGVGSERPWDTGNVNATVVGRTHFIAYYSGAAPDTAVYALPVLAPGRGK